MANKRHPNDLEKLPSIKLKVYIVHPEKDGKMYGYITPVDNLWKELGGRNTAVFSGLENAPQAIIEAYQTGLAKREGGEK